MLRPDGELIIDTPPIFEPLLQPKRYAGARGGRGSGKSHFFCEQLVEEAAGEHIRGACLREVQNSIKDSVKQLIEDKIYKLGLSSLFRITEKEITCPSTDSLFIFRGLQNHTAASIKSLEGFNRALVEEAQTISQKSLDLMTPTFRGGSRMRFAWNPNTPKDPIEKLFKDNEGDPDFVLVNANYYDNPWFPEDLRGDMERDKRRDPDKYAHVWLGKYQQRTSSRVFRNWRIADGNRESDRPCFDPSYGTEFRFGADWGFAVDPTVLVRAFLRGRTLFIDREAYQVGCEIDNTPQLFETIPGSKRWPITADSARPETISYMRRQGFQIRPAVKGPGSLEDGVEFLKSFDIVVHPDCTHTIDELATYSYKIDRLTDEVLPVLEDKENHVIDSLRYSCEALRRAEVRDYEDEPERFGTGRSKVTGY